MILNIVDFDTFNTTHLLASILKAININKVPKACNRPTTIFLSLKIDDDTPYNTLVERVNITTKKLFKEYSEIKDFTVIHNLYPHGSCIRGPLYDIGEFIKKIDSCDAVYMFEGWENNKECVIEYMIAMMYDKCILYEK